MTAASRGVRAVQGLAWRLRQLLVVAALALALLMLTADRLCASGWPPWLADHLPSGILSMTPPGALPGVYPLAALVLIVIVAYSAYLWLPWLAWLVPVLAAAASIMLVVDLPDALNHSKTATVDLWARIPAALILAMLFAKILLLHRHATWAHARGRAAQPPYRLLPCQQDDVDKLRRLIRDANYDRVLPIQGRQGEGKSFLVQQLKQEWDLDPAAPAVVVVDVWQQQKEADLQAAIFESLLSHPTYMAHLNWLRVPAIFLLERWVTALREARSSLALGPRNSRANFELRFDIPSIQWQRHLERIIAHSKAARGGTVVVLDELDRAAPAVTQAALTLARRSVAISNVTVIIPYVHAQVRYKVFNPMQTVLPDLASSMDAVLYDDRFGRQVAGDVDTGSAETVLEFWDDLRSKFSVERRNLSSSSSDDSGEHQLAAPEGAQKSAANVFSRRNREDQPLAHLDGFLGKPPVGADALAMALRFGVFAAAPWPRRERLQRLFEEKYLSPAGIIVRPPGPKDLAAMVTTHFPSLARLACALLSPAPATDQPAQANLSTVGDAVQQGLGNWLTMKDKLVRPPIRALLGILHENLSMANSLAEERHVSLSPQQVATIVLAAYDAASLAYGAGGGTA